jgi:hypothetical protein
LTNLLQYPLEPFELYVQQKTPIEVAIALNLEAEIAIQYHQQYFMLLGCTELTKVYPQIKDNPWPFVNLVKLVQNSGMGDGEVMEILKIANGYFPRVRLEYDRLKAELDSLKAELNSWKAEINNSVRVYQQFCDRNISLKNREDELQLNIIELKDKEKELRKLTTELKQHLSRLQENISNDTNMSPEVKQGGIISTNDVLLPPPNMAINCHQNENDTFYYPPQVEASSRTLIFGTKDLG